MRHTTSMSQKPYDTVALPAHPILHILLAMLVAAVLVLILARPAVADDVCYVVADNAHGDGVDAEGAADALILINPFTGKEKVIARTGTNEIESIDFDPETGILYAADSDQVGTIDLSTGAFKPLKYRLGKGKGSLGELTYLDVDGLAFDPTDGVLYGSVRKRDADLLIVIDHKTGKLVEDAFGNNVDYIIIEPVNNLKDIDDLAFDKDGRLYGTANSDGSDDRLVRIDTNTGATQDRGRIRAGSEGLHNFEAFTSNPDGLLIGIQGGESKAVYKIGTDGKSELLSSLAKASDYEAVSCMQPEPKIDLDKSVDRPAPVKGQEIVFTIRIENESIRVRDLLVVDKLPKGLKLLDTSHSEGSVDVSSDGRTIKWKLSALDPNQKEKLEIRARVETEKHVENCAVVESSSPSLRKTEKSCVSVTPCESSGGGDAGVESDGNVATMLATRLFSRRQDVQMKQSIMAAPLPEIFDAGRLSAGKSGSLNLSPFVPSTGPESSAAYEVTPVDLLGLTNATSVLAVDYLRPEGRRMGALFAATSPGGILYDHAKTTCDRLGGGTLDAVKTIDIDGKTFVLSRLIHADGATDHAISFVGYRTSSGYTIDSRFTPEEYVIPADAQEVVNLQVWSVAPQYTADLVRDVISRMASDGNVTFLNSPENAPAAPQVYVKDGLYGNGGFTLRVANGSTPTSVVVRGSTALTETDAENGIRTDFERTVIVPAVPEGDDAADVRLDLGYVFDAVIEVIDTTSGSTDKLYYSDGPWSYARGQQATVASFQTKPETGASTAGRYPVERSASLTGQVTDWASLFKFLRPGGQPVDLSEYRYLEFDAKGQGLVQVVVEKASIDTWDQFSYLINLTPENRTYQIPFYRFARSAGTGGFTAEDVTLVAFYVLGDRQAAASFSMSVDKLGFGGAPTSVAVDPVEELPSDIRLAQNYPNPFNPATRIDFTLPSAMTARLSVFDMLGREVAVLVNGRLPAGTHSAAFDGSALSSGTYIYRLSTPDQTLTGKMLLAK